MLLQKYVTCRSPLLSCDCFFQQHPFTEVCSSSSPHTLVGPERSPENSSLHTHTSIHKWYGREASVHSARSKWHSLCLSGGIRLEDRFRDCCILFFFFSREIEVGGRSRERDGGLWGFWEGGVSRRWRLHHWIHPETLTVFPFSLAFQPPHQHQAALHSAHSRSTSFFFSIHHDWCLPMAHTLACSLSMTLSLFSCPPPPPTPSSLPQSPCYGARKRGSGGINHC